MAELLDFEQSAACGRVGFRRVGGLSSRSLDQTGSTRAREQSVAFRRGVAGSRCEFLDLLSVQDLRQVFGHYGNYTARGCATAAAAPGTGTSNGLGSVEARNRGLFEDE